MPAGGSERRGRLRKARPDWPGANAAAGRLLYQIDCQIIDRTHYRSLREQIDYQIVVIIDYRLAIAWQIIA